MAKLANGVPRPPYPPPPSPDAPRRPCVREQHAWAACADGCLFAGRLPRTLRLRLLNAGYHCQVPDISVHRKEAGEVGLCMQVKVCVHAGEVRLCMQVKVCVRAGEG